MALRTSPRRTCTQLCFIRRDHMPEKRSKKLRRQQSPRFEPTDNDERFDDREDEHILHCDSSSTQCSNRPNIHRIDRIDKLDEEASRSRVRLIIYGGIICTLTLVALLLVAPDTVSGMVANLTPDKTPTPRKKQRTVLRRPQIPSPPPASPPSVPFFPSAHVGGAFLLWSPPPPSIPSPPVGPSPPHPPPPLSPPSPPPPKPPAPLVWVRHTGTRCWKDGMGADALPEDQGQRVRNKNGLDIDSLPACQAKVCASPKPIPTCVLAPSWTKGTKEISQGRMRATPHLVPRMMHSRTHAFRLHIYSTTPLCVQSPQPCHRLLNCSHRFIIDRSRSPSFDFLMSTRSARKRLRVGGSSSSLPAPIIMARSTAGAAIVSAPSTWPSASQTSSSTSTCSRGYLLLRHSPLRQIHQPSSRPPATTRHPLRLPPTILVRPARRRRPPLLHLLLRG